MLSTIAFFTVCQLLMIIGVDSGNILFVAAPGSASHRRSMFPLAEALAKDGHNVTMFSELIEQDNVVGKHMNNILPLINISAEGHDEQIEYMTWKQKFFTPLMLLFPWTMTSTVTNTFVEQKKHVFDQIVTSEWDLIFTDALFTPSGILFAAMSKAPYVLYQTTAIGIPESFYRSIPFPASTIPSLFLQAFSYDHNNFMDRLSSVWSEMSYLSTAAFVDHFVIQKKLSSMYPQISLSEFYNLADTAFVDYPLALDYPRPIMSDIFDIAGKCKTAKLTDKHLLEFVEDPSSKGTIVVAFGHMVKWHTAPPHVKVDFAKALNSLKDYRIIWQYKGEPPIELGSHVKTMSWLPQTELLNHPKTKAFVSHGGLKSVKEAVCGEVPLVMIPFFAEQVRNGVLLKKAGSSELVNKHNISMESVSSALIKILSNDNYKQSVKRLKGIILDKPIKSERSAIFWSEFMIRHKGLPKKFFKIKGASLHWFVYFNLDILLPLFGVFLSLSYLLFRVACHVVTYLR